MPATLVSKAFDSYKIWYVSGENGISAIRCYQGSNEVGILVFYPDGSTLPADTASVVTDKIRLHYTLSQFNDVMGILRNERPLVVYFSSSYGGYVGTSSKEPVGEEES